VKNIITGWGTKHKMFPDWTAELNKQGKEQSSGKDHYITIPPLFLSPVLL
jgi:hypothetical protein